jgi:hypothetical protein
MISFGSDIRVFVATQPIDFRRGVHGLTGLVAENLHGDPYICAGRDYVAAGSLEPVSSLKSASPPPHNS